MEHIKIVAEIGCNHNGSVTLAKQLIDEAVLAGVDAVKFQTFVASELVTSYAKKADYQKRNTGADESQLDMISRLGLSQREYVEVSEYAKLNGVGVFSTAFDNVSIEFLESLGQNVWKIPSGEINDLPYLEKIASIDVPNKEIILSTGMSTMEEIRYATSILEKSKNTRFTLLHCNTDYPTVDGDMNLLALLELKNSFPDWKIGLSDHSVGTVAALAATGLGITFIEKHFTLNKAMQGPDHIASITPVELRQLCGEIRRAERMLGSPRKFVTQSEMKNRFIARKSIVANKVIHIGDTFTEDNITCKRPGNGISPIHWHEVLGRQADRNFERDELIRCGISWEDGNE